MPSGLPVASGRNIVFLLDVDNTLFDNDGFSDALNERLEHDFGVEGKKSYRSHYEALRDELGYADYLGAVQRLRNELDDDPNLLRLAAFILDYPFADHLFPHALEAIAHLRTMGMPAILSDGDMVLQPRKVQRSGLWQATDDRVLIYLHKQRRLEAVQRRWPADHYVMVEDKPQLLAQMKQQMGNALTTVFVRQGHYALEQQLLHGQPSPDITIERIGELRSLNAQDFLTPASGLAAGQVTAGKPEQP